MPDINDINVDVAVKMLDIQKDMTKEYEARQRVMENMSGIDKNLERSIHKQMAETSRHHNIVRQQYAYLIDSMEKMVKMEESAAKDTARKMVQSHKDQIKLHEEYARVAILQWDIELNKLKEINEQHKFIGKSIQDRLFVNLKEIEGFKSLIEQIRKLFPTLSIAKAGFAAGILTLLSFAREMYDSFEKSAAAFRKYAGIFRDTSKFIRGMAEGIAIQFKNVGVELDTVYSSIKTLGMEMGGLHNVTKELTITTSLLNSQFGVAEETTAEMLRNLAVISKSTMQSQKNMAYFAGNLSAAAGVPLQLVMGDIAKLSGVSFAMMSKMPLTIIKTAVEARKLNTTINEISNASRGILDFQNSVNAEMEASVLLGRGINLQRARELAYRGKLVESTQEILNISKKIDFQNLDVFQMEAFAKATGRSVEELTKMLQAEQEMIAARASADPNIQKQLRAYEDMKKLNESTVLESSKNLETMLMQKANQERMVALQNKWNQLLMQASQILLPILDFTLNIAGAMMSLFSITSQLMTPIGALVQNFSKALQFSMGLLSHTKNWSKAMLFMVDLGSKAFGMIGTFGKILGVFGKFLGPLGIIITGFQLISSIWKNLSAWWRGDIGVMQAMGNVVYDLIVKPFKDAWEWISGIFVGRSPSLLAMGVVKGLLSVQGMLYNALVYPFKKAWSWISGNPVTSTFSTDAQSPLETLTSQQTSAREARTEEESKSNVGQALNDILVAIKTLNSNLESGKIGLYMDGQLLSATLARQTSFKNGFGMNVA